MGLNQELKDFLSAYQAGEKIQTSKSDREYKKARTSLLNKQSSRLGMNDDLDREGKQLSNKYSQAKLDAIPASTDQVKARTDYIRAATDKMNTPAVGGAEDLGVSPVNPTTRPQVGPQSDATDTLGGAQGDEQKLSDASDSEDDESPAQDQIAAIDNPDPEQQVARGGPIKRVKKFADGGAVDSDDDDDDDDLPAAPTEAVPDTAPAAPAASAESDDEDTDTDISAAKRGSRGYSPLAGHDAARDGLIYTLKQNGLDKPAAVNDGSRVRALKAYHSGAGAAPREQVEAIRKAVDPEGKLSESERTLATLGTVYEHYLKKGDSKAAQASAASMLGYYRNVYDRYNALAKVAADHGDLDNAMRDALKAYDNVPDGISAKMGKDEKGNVFYSFTDENGKEIKKGLATPQQMLSAMSRGALNNSFDSLILRASGMRGEAAANAPANTPTKEPGVPKLQDRTRATSAIDTEAGATNDDATTGASTPKYKLPAGNESGVKDIAAQILPHNNISPSDALRLASTLVDTNKPNDMIEPQQDGSAKVKMQDGREFVLPRNAYLQAVAIRGKMAKGRAADETTALDKSNVDATRAAQDGADRERVTGAAQRIEARREDERKRTARHAGGNTIQRAVQHNYAVPE